MTATIKQYLKQLLKVMGKDNPHAKKYYSFILKNGKSFRSDYSWKKNKEKNKLIEGIQPKQKECYKNAQMLTIIGKLKYFEGFGFTKGIGKTGIAIPHAWCVNENRIIDITWEDGIEYFGVEIPFDYIKNAFNKGYFEAVLEDYIFKK